MPDDVSELFNIRLGHPHHATDLEVELPVLRGKFMKVIQKYCLRVDSHPVVTRFWTFSQCVRSMFLMVLLGLPLSTVLSVQSATQRPEQQRRLTKVKEYLRNPKSQSDIRVACLCLALTNLTTNLVSQQKKRAAGATLIALANGEVQHKAGKLAAVQLSALNEDPELPRERALLGLLTTLGHILIRCLQ